MPLNLIPGGPIATVDLGSGAHDPQIRFTAPDSSCIWNGFPVQLTAELFTPITPTDPAPTHLLSTFSGPDFTHGVAIASESEWPAMRVYDWDRSILSGYELEVDLTFHVAPISLSVLPHIYNTGTHSVHLIDTAYTPPAGTATYTGIDPGRPDCSVVLGADGSVAFSFAGESSSSFFGFAVDAGSMSGHWVSSGSPSATYDPSQSFALIWNPPGHAAEGLEVRLAVNGCGVATTTYSAIGSACLAANTAGTMPLVPSLIGAHGADVAAPDSDVMAGAVCSGFVNDKAALPL